MDQTSLENQEIGQSEGEGMQQNNISQHENNENGTDFKENGIDQPIRQEESEGSSSRSKKSSPVDTYTDMFPSLPTSSSKPTTTQITWVEFDFFSFFSPHFLRKILTSNLTFFRLNQQSNQEIPQKPLLLFLKNFVHLELEQSLTLKFAKLS